MCDGHDRNMDRWLDAEISSQKRKDPMLRRVISAEKGKIYNEECFFLWVLKYLLSCGLW